MYTDQLRETLHQIENHCAENKIPLFYGWVEAKTKRTVVWEPEARQGWKDYLGVLALLETKVLHINTIISEVPDAEETANLLAYGSTLEGEARADWQASYDIMEQTKGFVSDLTLVFLHEGLAYQWSGGVEWEEHYYDIQPPRAERNLVEEIDNMKEQDTEQIALEEERIKAERERLFDEEAEKFLSNEDYLVEYFKVNDRRSFVTQSLWGKYESMQDLLRIASKAEARFKTEVEGKRDDAIVEKIREIRKQRPKLTKTEIAGMLDLTERQMRRYWYRTEQAL